MSIEVPRDWKRIETIDVHTAGEPLRVIMGGYPEIPGDSILEKRRFARDELDDLRRAVMLEPRGHADMYGCILTEPVTPDGDVGVLFMHNGGYSTMCGHGIIGLVKVAVESGRLSVREDDPHIRIDTPAGRVVATPCLEGGQVREVSFENVPSLVLGADLEVEIEGIGLVRFDLVYGGAFYACVDAEAVGVALEPDNLPGIIDVGMKIKRGVADRFPPVHPSGDPDLNFLYGTILVGPAGGDAHSRNVCVFAEGEVDRSPTGTGVSGRAAVHFARGELAVGESMTIESILGTTFDVRVARATEVGGCLAVIPVVTGCAWITGKHEFLVDPADPLRKGFLFR